MQEVSVLMTQAKTQRFYTEKQIENKEHHFFIWSFGFERIGFEF